MNLSNNFFSSKFIQFISVTNFEKKGLVFVLKIVESVNKNTPFLEGGLKNSLKHWVEQFNAHRKIVITGYSTEEKETMMKLTNPINDDEARKNEKIKPQYMKEEKTKRSNNNQRLMTDFFKKKEAK